MRRLCENKRSVKMFRLLQEDYADDNIFDKIDEMN